MTKDQFLAKLVQFKKPDVKKDRILKNLDSIFVRDVFFLKRAKGTMALNWNNVKVIFGLSKQDVVSHLGRFAHNDKLSFALGNSPSFYEADFTEEELNVIKKFLANLPQDYIETEGRFKGKRWGKIIHRVYEHIGKLPSKEQIRKIAATIAS